MDDFDLLDEALDVLEPGIAETACLHPKTVVDKGMCVCKLCGLQLKRSTDETKVWSIQYKYCRRGGEEKNIFGDVENMGFSDNIIVIANKIYQMVTQKKIQRANTRKGIVCACIFQAFKINNVPQIYDDLTRRFDVKRKIALKGLKQVNIELLKFRGDPEYADLLTMVAVTPRTFIAHYMKSLDATASQIDEVLDLYNSLSSRHNIDRARPQSVAAGLLYYWIIESGKGITLKIVSRITNLSELTIVKLEKSIREKMISLAAAL